MERQHVLTGYLAKAGWSQSELSRRSGIASSDISRAVCGRRPLSRFAATEIARVMAEAYARGETKVRPLTREQLSPAFATKRAA
jgi:transcriptional regulator with XRE-family HTH domain